MSYGVKALDYGLVSPPQYDDVSGSAYIKEACPNAEIIAGEHAARVLQKPSAKALMRSLNLDAAKYYGWGSFEDKLDGLHVDRCVHDGDIIDMGSKSLEVWETPGHTKCSISFYCPEEKILFACETLGITADESTIAPCYIVDYQGSIVALERTLEDYVNWAVVGHVRMLEGHQATEFVGHSLLFTI